MAEQCIFNPQDAGLHTTGHPAPRDGRGFVRLKGPPAMRTFFLTLFGWWHNATWGTSFFTWRKGVQVGTDDQGNRYYRERSGPKNGNGRRWVIYNGNIDASRVPPEWHGWIHHTVDAPPTEKPLAVKAWEKPHQPNRTGSAEAYAPAGSLNAGGKRARAVGDYEAWKP
jgi:NADH:ubiquinone oxidoreductase subunit